MNNSGQPASPIQYYGRSNETVTSLGLTKREHFAGLAMQGLLSSESQASYEDFSIRAVGMADALLKELAK
jgi:hypothetical protein